MTFLLAAISLFALLSGILAAGQARTITQMAAMKGQDWLFGWWRFDAIAAKAGLAGEEHAAAYKRSVIAFVVFLVLGLLLSGWIASQQNAVPATVSANATINDGGFCPPDTLNNSRFAEWPRCPA